MRRFWHWSFPFLLPLIFFSIFAAIGVLAHMDKKDNRICLVWQEKGE